MFYFQSKYMVYTYLVLAPILPPILDSCFSFSHDTLLICLDKATNSVWICPILRLCFEAKEATLFKSCLSERVFTFILISLAFSNSIFHENESLPDQASHHLALIILSLPSFY